ncbi:FkbM family methyltransferase [Nocardioides aurantiacus]|nr:FkbM family methyltransferase [Nocardioides aurantiacus]
MQAIRHLEIDFVLDVGANTGQFASQIRRLGYDGTIVSFEPLSNALRVISQIAARDEKWTIQPYALGDVEQHLDIHVTRNLVSSSILEQGELLSRIDPGSTPVDTERILVRRLDSVYPDLVPRGARTLLKIDTQGYERQVLLGAGEWLETIAAVHLEVSLVELYGGEFLLSEALEFLESRGFRVLTMEPSLPDPVTGQLLQVDLTLDRRS